MVAYWTRDVIYHYIDKFKTRSLICKYGIAPTQTPDEASNNTIARSRGVDFVKSVAISWWV